MSETSKRALAERDLRWPGSTDTLTLAREVEALEAERDEWERLPLVERIRQLEELVSQESERANERGCKLEAAERKLAEVRALLESWRVSGVMNAADVFAILDDDKEEP